MRKATKSSWPGARTSRRRPRIVLKEINRLIGSKFFSRTEQKEREYRYGDFAILCRRKAEGTKYYHLLRKNLIPCEFVGEFNFFGSPAIRELTAYLRATENPLQAGTSLFKIMKDSGITEVNVRRINHCAKRLAYNDNASDHVYECMTGRRQHRARPARRRSRRLSTTVDRMIALKRDNCIRLRTGLRDHDERVGHVPQEPGRRPRRQSQYPPAEQVLRAVHGVRVDHTPCHADQLPGIHRHAPQLPHRVRRQRRRRQRQDHDGAPEQGQRVPRRLHRRHGHKQVPAAIPVQRLLRAQRPVPGHQDRGR